MRIGVFALQGDVREHISILNELGVECCEFRKSEDLPEIDGLIFPGGESTTMSKLIDIFGLRQSLHEFIAAGKPVFGTCAGMIMMASTVIDSAAGQTSLGVMDIAVRRNAFGSQLDSFEEEVDFKGEKVNVAFIRAPIVEQVGPEVEVLSRLEDGRIVAVRQNNLLATSFHPEITGETLVHKYFVDMVSSSI